MIRLFSPALIITDQPSACDNRISFPFEELLSCSTTHPVEPAVFSDDDVFTVNFTSGTTGLPKTIELKKKSFDHLVAGAQALYDFRVSDRFLIFLPLHVYLDRCYIYAAILIGFSVVLTPMEMLFTSLKSDRPSVIIGIPYFFETVQAQFIARINARWYFRAIMKLYLSAKKFGFMKSFPPFLKVWGGFYPLPAHGFCSNQNARS
jgi:long-subunit acyl-CoA synthetase (AMP-forming)